MMGYVFPWPIAFLLQSLTTHSLIAGSTSYAFTIFLLSVKRQCCFSTLMNGLSVQLDYYYKTQTIGSASKPRINSLSRRRSLDLGGAAWIKAGDFPRAPQYLGITVCLAVIQQSRHLELPRHHEKSMPSHRHVRKQADQPLWQLVLYIDNANGPCVLQTRRIDDRLFVENYHL